MLGIFSKWLAVMYTLTFTMHRAGSLLSTMSSMRLSMPSHSYDIMFIASVRHPRTEAPILALERTDGGGGC